MKFCIVHRQELESIAIDASQGEEISDKQFKRMFSFWIKANGGAERLAEKM